MALLGHTKLIAPRRSWSGWRARGPEPWSPASGYPIPSESHRWPTSGHLPEPFLCLLHSHPCLQPYLSPGSFLAYKQIPGSPLPLKPSPSFASQQAKFLPITPLLSSQTLADLSLTTSTSALPVALSPPVPQHLPAHPPRWPSS